MISTRKPETDVGMKLDPNPEVDSIDKLWLRMISTQEPDTDVVTSSTEKPDTNFKRSSTQQPDNEVGTRWDQIPEVDSIDKLWFSLRNNPEIEETVVSNIEMESNKS